jgi:4'-phosphopantetheinyl transferase
LLGQALGVEPRGIVLPVGKHGKPFVNGVQFNVTHSKGLILLALSKNTEIGIDVEWKDPGIEAMEIAQDTFAPAEIAHIAAAAEGDERVRAFYRCWVRKEAVAKAHGQGITLSLQDFQVDLTSDVETHVSVNTDSSGFQDFYIRSLPVETGYSGALALAIPGCTVRLFDLPRAMIIGQ